MKTRALILGLAGLLAVLGLTPGAKAAYTVNYNLGDVLIEDELSGYGTHGSDMPGMIVLAEFADNTDDTATWVSLGYPAGEAVGTGWSLYESGNTFNSLWTLTNSTGKSLSRLVIDAWVGDTVFDREYDLYGSLYGTAGSQQGRDFEPINHDSYTIVATYINAVKLTDASGDPNGDIYQYLEIAFDNEGGLGDGQSLQFYADTDNIYSGGEIPEPGTALLIACGLLGAAWYSRARRA